jgi:hypothetical protein
MSVDAELLADRPLVVSDPVRLVGKHRDRRARGHVEPGVLVNIWGVGDWGRLGS